MILAHLLHMSTCSIYLTGPHRWEALVAAATALRAAGFGVQAPHEKPDYLSLGAALAADVEALIAADAVVVVPGWEEHPGCVVEVRLAEALGKPVVTLAEALEVPMCA